MLDLIDTSLEAFFRATVPLSAQDVDVAFDPPDRDWSAKLTRPTVNLFLRDLRRSSDRAQAGVEEIERDGQLVRRMALPRVELRYLVTVWTSEHGDERSLMSGVMRAVLAHGEIPPTFLADGLGDRSPPQLLMARTTDDHADSSAMIDGQLKPGINMTVVTVVDTDVSTPAGPPVAVLESRLSAIGDGHHNAFAARRVAGEVDDPTAVGATVLSPCGSTTVNAAGRFVVAARAGDELVIETQPPRRVVVPIEGGVRVT